MGVCMNRNRNRVALAFAVLAVICFCAVLGAQTLTAPKFKFDSDWPKPLPNKWKLGGVTGLAVDKDDNVWVLIRRQLSGRARNGLRSRYVSVQTRLGCVWTCTLGSHDE